METSEEDAENQSTGNQVSPNQIGYSIPTDQPLRMANGNLRRPPPQELDWNTKLDMVQQLINQAMLRLGRMAVLTLLYLPGQGGGIPQPPREQPVGHTSCPTSDCSTAQCPLSVVTPPAARTVPQRVTGLWWNWRQITKCLSTIIPSICTYNTISILYPKLLLKH